MANIWDIFSKHWYTQAALPRPPGNLRYHSRGRIYSRKWTTLPYRFERATVDSFLWMTRNFRILSRPTSYCSWTNFAKDSRIWNTPLQYSQPTVRHRMNSLVLSWTNFDLSSWWTLSASRYGHMHCQTMKLLNQTAAAAKMPTLVVTACWFMDPSLRETSRPIYICPGKLVTGLLASTAMLS